MAGAVVLTGRFNASAFVTSYLAGDFTFGPNLANFSEPASLASFNGPGTLLGVKIEFSGSAAISFNANLIPSAASGTVDFFKLDTSFLVSGLPHAPLATTLSTTEGPFDLPPVVSFDDTISTATLIAMLSAPSDIGDYDQTVTGQALLPFMFEGKQTLLAQTSGGGVSTDAESLITGSVKVWYTYDNLLSPPPVPEVSTAVSAAGFVLTGAFFLRRGKRTR